MNIVGAPPDMVRWIPRNPENGDCALIAVQLATGLTYEAVLAAAVHVYPAVVTSGLSWSEIRRLVRRLGYHSTLLRRTAYDLDTATGILNVRGTKVDHVVYLWAGRVVEPVDQSLWLDADDYLAVRRLRAARLLVVSR